MLCEYTPFFCGLFLKQFYAMRKSSHSYEKKILIAMRIIPCLNSLKQRILVIFPPMHNTDNREVQSEEIFPDYRHEE